MSNAVQRILVAVVAIPLAVVVVYLGGVVFALLVAVLAVLGASELMGLARRAGLRPLAPLVWVVSLAFPLGVWATYSGGGPWGQSMAISWAAMTPSSFYLLALFTLVTLTATLLLRSPTDQPLATAGVTMLIPLYCGALPSFALGIRYGVGPTGHWAATWALFLPLAITWICDTAAMYVGKMVGGPKLAPVISPGKTRSGGLAGVAGGVLTAIVYNQVALVPSGFTLAWWEAAGIGLTLSIVAQVGDLTESVFKREVGVKDSGRLIPGHGGVLDRLDSLYFVIPVAAMLYRFLGVI